MKRLAIAIAEWMTKPLICKLNLHDWQYVSVSEGMRPAYRLCPVCTKQQILRQINMGAYYDGLSHGESIKWSNMRTQIMREYRKKMKGK